MQLRNIGRAKCIICPTNHTVGIGQLPYGAHYVPAPQWRRDAFERGWGTPVRRKAPENIFGSRPSTFLALKVQLVVLVSAFVMVSTVWSVSCLLFYYSRCPPRAQPFVKVGERAPIPYGVGATARPCVAYWFVLSLNAE